MLGQVQLPAMTMTEYFHPIIAATGARPKEQS
jgi:hypothetical protein